jgi:exonuclease III
MDSHNRSNNR